LPLFSPQDREKIEELLGELVNPVRLLLFTIPQTGLIVPGRATCETCEDAQKLLEELAGLSDKLSLEIHHFEQEREIAARFGVERVPSVLVLGPEDGRVRYSGAPFGHEFALLLQDIRIASSGETQLAQETRDALAAIPEPINIQVFVTPT
jgi:alkyl hydroperoxide reductase subunit AhpF